jgi:hypothetical protein
MSEDFWEWVKTTPAYQAYERDFNAAMKDAETRTQPNCPVCGNRMISHLGLGRVVAYSCQPGSRCVGVYATVEQLEDPAQYEQVVEGAKSRWAQFSAMRERNGVADEGREGHWDWCGTCVGYHPPTEEHPRCKLCHSMHAPMPEGIYFDYRGWKFTPPFICMGCGMEVCFRQWAYSRLCGPCDNGKSKTRRLTGGQCFVGPHVKLPTWDAAQHDLEESGFIDPVNRERYRPLRFVSQLS